MPTALTRSLTLEAPAKVNLCLAVSYPPRGGFHELGSVFQALSLHDTLTFEVLEAAGGQLAGEAARTQAGTVVALACEGAGVPTCDNLIFKAIDAFEQAGGQAVLPAGSMLHVQVRKRIPAGGGLGGGSSDAAAALRACAWLLGQDALGGPCQRVAQGLGADVAFFLQGGCALMGGKGDVLQQRLPAFPLPLVLLGDAQGNSTPAVYRAFDAAPAAAPDARALADALLAGNATPQQLAALCGNNLGPAACKLNPSLGLRLQQAQADADVLAAVVSGSGSTCYAVCAGEAQARAFAQRAAAYSAWVEVVHAA